MTVSVSGQLVLPARLRAKSISLTLAGANSYYGGRLVFPAAEPGGAATSFVVRRAGGAEPLDPPN